MNFGEYHRFICKNSAISPFIRVPIIMGSSWLFQSLLIMDHTEKFFKIFLDLMLFVLFFYAFENFGNIYSIVIYSYITAHTINWIINGQIPVALKNLGLLKTPPQKMNEYSIKLAKKIQKNTHFRFAAFYGSLSTNSINEKSDLDVRVVRKSGPVNALKSILFIIVERNIALYNFIPLDIYVLDNMKKTNKLKESPVIILEY